MPPSARGGPAWPGHPSIPECVHGSAHEVESEHGAQLAQCQIGIVHLDGGHAQGAGRLEIAADVVEEGRLRGFHPQLAAGELIDARIGLAQPHHARLDEDVKQLAQSCASRPHLARHPVVGEGGHAQAACPDAADGLEHARPGDGGLGDVGHHPCAVHLQAVLSAVDLEGREEVGHGQLPALQARPRAVVARRRDGVVDGVGRQTVVVLVARDGAQGGVHDHAAQIEDHRRDLAHRGLPYPERRSRGTGSGTARLTRRIDRPTVTPVLLTNGRIYTLDAGNTVAESLVIRDGRVAFAGRRTDINPGAGEEIVDLQGRAVLPGLVDAHAHLMMLAPSRLSLDLSRAQSEDEIASLVGAATRRAVEGEWLTGRGWDQTLWPEPRFPTRASLDGVAPRHPVALTRVDGHATWANSAALRVAGIDRGRGDPPGGRILRGAEGEPTGLLIDTAQELIRVVQPLPAPERFEAALREAVAQCLAKGLTGLHEMGVHLDTIAAYRRLSGRGQFPLRNYVALSGKKAWAHYRQRGIESMGDGRIVVGAIKLWLDGALGSRGAALHAPYCDDPENTGLLLVPPEEVERQTLDALDHGFQMCVHAIGDRANTLVLDAFDRALAKASPAARADHRLRVEHAQILAEPDIPRFARLGVLPSMQPTHCTSDMRWAEARLGPVRLAGAYAWRSLLAAGSLIAGGSDFPVEDANPFHGIYAAVARRPLAGEDPGWRRDQCMTRAEAVRAFTTWNAFASRREADLGSLEPGKRADLVVLSEDVFTCPEASIKAIVPEMTMVDGEVVFARDGTRA